MDVNAQRTRQTAAELFSAAATGVPGLTSGSDAH